jgi:hypothetical protein
MVGEKGPWMKCPACENDVPSGRSACTWCGAPLPSAGERPGSEPRFVSEPLTNPQAGPSNPKTEPMPIPDWNAGDEWPELPPIRPATPPADPPPPGPEQAAENQGAPLPPAFDPVGGWKRETPPTDPPPPPRADAWPELPPIRPATPRADAPPPVQENATQNLGAPLPPAFDPAGGWKRDTPPPSPPPPGQDNATQSLGTPYPPAYDSAGWNREAPPASPPPPGQDNATQSLGSPYPPTFDPGGWDQGVPPGAGDPSAPPPGGGAAKSRKNLLLAGGMAAVVVIGGAVIYAVTQGGSGSDTQTAGGKTGAKGAAAQAAAVNQILKSGKTARGHLPSRLRTCDDVAAGVSGFQQVVRDRQQELSQSKGLKVDQLPNGAGLRTSMVAAYQSSLKADQAYLAWAQEIQGRGCGGKIAPLTGHYKAAIAANGKAGPAKRQVVAAWKPIAASHGLPKYVWNRL